MVGLADYSPLAVLGRGPLGVLWRARRDLDGRMVAVRVLDPALQSADPRVGAARAVPSAGRNVAEVLGLHADPAATVVASELLHGVTLRKLLERGPIPVLQATAILAGILRGLTQGRVLHLDVAPENVWIDAAGVVKLTDFGLVNLRRPGSGRWSLLEGRPASVSPEQIRGSGVDSRSDVYGAAAVYYEMVTGAPPFGTGPDETVLAAHFLSFVPPIDRFPAPLGQLVLRALHPDPSRRPATPEAFNRELHQAAWTCLSPDWRDEAALGRLATPTPPVLTLPPPFPAQTSAVAPPPTFASQPPGPYGAPPPAYGYQPPPTRPRRPRLIIAAAVALVVVVAGVGGVVIATSGSSKNHTSAPTTVAPTTTPTITPSAPTAAPSKVAPATGAITAFSAHPVNHQGELDWVSCPTTSFCMAVSASDPAAEAFTWDGHSWSGATVADHTPLIGSNYGSLSCASTTFCMVVGIEASDDAATVQNIDTVVWNGSTWSTPAKLSTRSGQPSLSCPTASFCMLTDSSQAWVYRSGQWSAPSKLPGDFQGLGDYFSLSCASPTFCLSVSQNTITWNGTKWSSNQNTVAMGLITGLSCPTAAFCGVVGAPEDSGVGSTIGATWTPQGWSGTSTIVGHLGQDGIGLVSLSCPVAGNCYALSQEGAVYHLAGGHWGPAITADGPIGNPGSISCPIASFCAVADQNGNVLMPTS
jgi:serine/threonine protein kinase